MDIRDDVIAKSGTAAFFRLADENLGWEPFLVEDRQIGEVNIIRETASEFGGTLIVALWRSQPQTFSYRFETDETLYLIDGQVEIIYSDKASLVLKAGDSVSFAKGYDTVWNVIAPSKKLFVAG